MFAVIETGGKQYKVQNGDVIYVEKLAAEDNSEISFQVVALGGEDGLKVGTPYVDGASVTGKVLKNRQGQRRSLSSLTSLRRALSARWVTDSHTQRLRSPLSTRNS